MLDQIDSDIDQLRDDLTTAASPQEIDALHAKINDHVKRTDQILDAFFPRGLKAVTARLAKTEPEGLLHDLLVGSFSGMTAGPIVAALAGESLSMALVKGLFYGGLVDFLKALLRRMLK